eukprot:CAMPEP_0194207448 /NCGR_PEP_ID=MMETSP0156-20130528/6184_1 /TAXON_ID=33649 /ORGANISM="Thalassionema nitzschioides, Strain L26-B" /LENGTH=473 /DNA_ID=CAMNT_0038934215 /DNA_START=86 /DNA_END=1504 /DNA_ORIENTATION=+
MPPQASESSLSPNNPPVDDAQVHAARNGCSTMTQFDPNELARRSMVRRKSFLVEFLDTKGPPQILVVMILLAIGFGATIGVVPAVTTDRYARLNHGYKDLQECSSWVVKPEECLAGSSDAQNAAAIESLVSNTFTFIMSSLLGAISDEVGRRGILLLGLSMSCTSTICLVLMQIIPRMSPNWYYIARASSGLVNWMAICLSCLSDVLPPKWRAAGFGMLLASFSLGIAFSPLLAVFLNHFYVSVVSVCILAVAWLVMFFFLPETLPRAVAAEAKRRRESERHAEATRWGRTVHMLGRPLRELSILNRNTFFQLLAALAFFSGMVSQADQTLLLYYLEERLAFNDKDIAKMFLLMGTLGILVQGVLIKPFIYCVGEKYVIVLAFLVGSFHNVLYGIASEKWEIFISISLASFVGMSFPTISAIKANNVAENEQGRIQGALYSIQALAAGTGPMILRFVYQFTKESSFPGPGTMW